MKTKLKELQLKRNDKLFINIALIGTIILTIVSVGLRTTTQKNKTEHDNQSQLVSQSNSENFSKEPSSSSSEKNSSTSTTTTSPSSSSSEETSTESSTATESSSSSSSEETSTKSTTTPNSPSTETASQEDTTSPIVIDVNEFTSKFDTGELEHNVHYQVTAELTDKSLWDWNADMTYYNIYILGANPDGIVESFILRASKETATQLKNNNQATLTLQVKDDYYVYVVSIAPN